MMDCRKKRTLLCGAWIALFLIMVPVLTRANVGPPMSGGQIVAEPTGVIGIAITRETLTIDLRPLGANGFARVEALYHLRNGGAQKTLELVSASGSANVTDFQVWLGAEPVPVKSVEGAALPQSWRPPEQTPGLHGERGVDYLSLGAGDVTPVGFTVTVPPGSHDLKVRYTADAATYHRGDPTVLRQFAYILSPARAWAEFGGLDVEVLLPEKWRAASTPDLAREGDTLKGSFAALPAGAIALTVQAPEGWAYGPLTYAGMGLFGLAVLGGAVVCWRWGRSKGRRLAARIGTRSNWLGRHAWPASIGLGMAWGLAILASGLFAIFAPELALPPGQASHYGYGQAFALYGVLLLSLFAAPVGFVIAQMSAVRKRRRELAKEIPETNVKEGVGEPLPGHGSPETGGNDPGRGVITK